MTRNQGAIHVPIRSGPRHDGNKVRVDQFAFKHLVYRPVTWLRGQQVFANLRLLEDSQWHSRDELRRGQLHRLQKLIEMARSGAPAYRSRLRGLPERIETLQRLGDVPTLNKQDLRNEYAALLVTPTPALCTRKTTGGSTGEPVTLLKSRAAMALELAATWRGYRWAGVDVGDRQARFWGVPIDRSGRWKARLIDYVCHRRRFSAFDFDSSKFSAYAASLAQFEPDYLYGYVSMLAEFARWLRSRPATKIPRPKAIITTSEVLAPDDRAVLREAFGCPVFNEYGCGELGTIAHECPEGRLHLSEENMIVEILDGDRPCGPAEKGEIVVTELNNAAMPLIRYRTGDFGSLAGEACACGRTLGVLEQVFGRAYDFIVTPSGRKFHAEFLMYVFEEAQRHQIGIAQFQVRQTAPDALHVLVVPAPSGLTDDALANLEARMKQLLSHEMAITFSRTERIARESSGKLRVIVGLSHSARTDTLANQTC